MPHLNPDGRNPARTAKPATTALIILLLACLGVTACGESLKSTSAGASTSTSTSAGASTSTSAGASASTSTAAGTSTSTAAGAAVATTGASAATRRAGSGASRSNAIRECLQKNGITLSQRTAGAGGLLGGAGGPQLPKGVTRSQYEASVKKCGGRAFGGAGHVNDPVYKLALAKFAACMRENGVNVPTPNTSGSGPVFNTKGLNTTSTQFKAAETRCTSDLTGGSRPGRTGDAGGSG